jgi:tetratricopeptide (TPR) repeat protein
VLGADHADTLECLSSLGGCLSRVSQFQNAAQVYREVLNGRRRTLGETHPDALLAMRELVVVLLAQQGLDEAQPLLRDLARRLPAKPTGRLPDARWARLTLAEVFARSAEWEQADTAFRSLLQDYPDDFTIATASAMPMLMMENRPAYDERCRLLFERFGDTAHAAQADGLATAALLVPLPVASPEALTRQVEIVGSRHANPAKRHLVEGMAHYRGSNWTAAVTRLAQVRTNATTASLVALSGCFQAMARYQLGDTNGARSALTGSQRIVARTLAQGDLGPEWVGFARCLAVSREAEALLFGKPVSPMLDPATLAAARRTRR